MKRIITIALFLALVLLCGIQIAADTCNHGGEYVMKEYVVIGPYYVDAQKHRTDEYELWGCQECDLIDFRRHEVSHDAAHSYTLYDILYNYDENSDCYRYRCACGDSFDQWVPNN